jgi:U32 family peptidase
MNQIVRRKAGSFAGSKPEILAPAGNQDSFLAALAAGADAIYCGLKSHSARMAAKNFTMQELAPLADLARKQGTKLYMTFNTLLKPDELKPVGQLLTQVNHMIQPDALIIQDLAVAALAKQAGFGGEIHLSTLANVTMSHILPRLPKTFGVQRVVLPRELDVDEIKNMAAACPSDLGLEIFVHGALCYGVSGRCYWSSYLGGKSGLRGSCVQPCRRRYDQDKQSHRYFACQDLSLDVLAKVLAGVSQIRAWKIEGRKKGPHYVYYTVTAYQMLRDEGQDPQMKKAAIQLLGQALGRAGTHYHFLPQRPQNPIDTTAPSGSGMLVGTVRGGHTQPYFVPRVDLLPDDKLRIGCEDDHWHQTLDLAKGVPKHGNFNIKLVRGRAPAKGTPVFLIDRREPALAEKIQQLQRQLVPAAAVVQAESTFTLRLPPGSPRKPYVHRMHVRRGAGHWMRKASLALWLDVGEPNRVFTDDTERIWWWLPPVIWPSEEAAWIELIKELLRHGASHFVLNAPWQIALFHRPDQLSLWAGPFCNITNPLAIRAFKMLGGQGVIVSPELGQADLEVLGNKSVLPLGIVVSGHWPFCVSRALADEFKPDQPFVSPKGEQGWVQRHGQLYWTYPNWPIDLRPVQERLNQLGYRMFVHLDEPVPHAVQIKKRPGWWNWDIGLK